MRVSEALGFRAGRTLSSGASEDREALGTGGLYTCCSAEAAGHPILPEDAKRLCRRSQEATCVGTHKE